VTDYLRAEDVLDVVEDEDDRPTLPPPSEKIAELLIQARDSIVNVEDGELQVIARISAEFGTPVTAAGRGRESAESLRDSEVDRLALEVEPDVPAPETKSDSGKREISERITVMPRTHPLANSIAPTAVAKSVAPTAEKRGPFWQIVAAAAAVVGLGVGLGQLPSSHPEARDEHAAETRTGVHATASAPVVRPVLAAEAAEPVHEVPAAPAPAQPIAEAEVQPEQPLAVQPDSPAPSAEASAPERQPRPVSEAKSASSRESRPRVARSEKRARANSGPLPAQPSREAVVATMKAAMPALARCTGGRKGSVSAQLTVRSSGQVSYALVQGSFAGTPEGSCLAQALRDVRFPAFSEPSLRLTYPLQF
jgi:hypothetical protein